MPEDFILVLFVNVFKICFRCVKRCGTREPRNGRDDDDQYYEGRFKQNQNNYGNKSQRITFFGKQLGKRIKGYGCAAGPMRFRRNLERIAEVIGYEISKKMET